MLTMASVLIILDTLISRHWVCNARLWRRRVPHAVSCVWTASTPLNDGQGRNCSAAQPTWTKQAWLADFENQLPVLCSDFCQYLCLIWYPWTCQRFPSWHGSHPLLFFLAPLFVICLQCLWFNSEIFIAFAVIAIYFAFSSLLVTFMIANEYLLAFLFIWSKSQLCIFLRLPWQDNIWLLLQVIASGQLQVPHIYTHN